MNATLDDLDQRLRGIEGALRLRRAEAEDPWGRASPGVERGRADVLRLRWHRDLPSGADVS